MTGPRRRGADMPPLPRTPPLPAECRLRDYRNDRYGRISYAPFSGSTNSFHTLS